ncbi:MAG TPA: hypothetical protein VMV20_06255 [Chitinophagaceae bacterium]|nr:hypothetical protein [Chitinophagaceae bacterium]
MQPRYLSFLILLAIASCGPSRRDQDLNPGIPDGSSLQRAILIHPIPGNQGVAEEYDWVSSHYPGWRTHQQTRIQVRKKYYDVLDIDNIQGEQKILYFDITLVYPGNRGK